MKNELIIRTNHLISNEELMMYEEDVMRFLRHVTLDKIMNEIKENGMDLLDQRVTDNPELNGQDYETNLVIIKTSEYQRLKAIEREYTKSLKVWHEVNGI